MKVVKADAKGRVTGMSPGETYEVTEGLEGTVLRRVERDTPWKYHDVTKEQFEEFYGEEIQNILVGQDAEPLREQDSKGYYPQGIAYRVTGVPERGQVRKVIIRVKKPE